MEKVTSKQLFNAKNSATKAEELKEIPMKIKAVGEYQDKVKNSETGIEEDRVIRVIVFEDSKGQEVITASPSETLSKSLDSAVEYIDSEGAGDQLFFITTGKSKAGRSFLTLRMAQSRKAKSMLVNQIAQTLEAGLKQAMGEAWVVKPANEEGVVEPYTITELVALGRDWLLSGDYSRNNIMFKALYDMAGYYVFQTRILDRIGDGLIKDYDT